MVTSVALSLIKMALNQDQKELWILQENRIDDNVIIKIPQEIPHL